MVRACYGLKLYRPRTIKGCGMGSTTKSSRECTGQGCATSELASSALGPGRHGVVRFITAAVQKIAESSKITTNYHLLKYCYYKLDHRATLLNDDKN